MTIDKVLTIYIYKLIILYCTKLMIRSSIIAFLIISKDYKSYVHCLLLVTCLLAKVELTVNLPFLNDGYCTVLPFNPSNEVLLPSQNHLVNMGLGRPDIL